MNEGVGGGTGSTARCGAHTVSPLGRARLWPARAVCSQADGRSAGRAALDVAKKHCMDIKKQRNRNLLRQGLFLRCFALRRAQRETIWAGLSILGDPGRATE